jgi:DNA-binding NtrC family response regulator
LEEAVSRAVEEVEKRMIIEALKRAGGNKTKAAGLLKISRKSLHNKLKKYNLD